MAKVRLLICDDALLYSTALSHWLRDDPEIEVIDRVRTGGEALERTEVLRPDVVLLDHILPDGVSADFAPRLRELVADLGIVLISGLAEDQLVKQAEAIRAEACVRKSATVDAIRTAVLSSVRAPD